MSVESTTRADRPSSALDGVACPWCGKTPLRAATYAESDGTCPSCGKAWKARDRVVEWPGGKGVGRDLGKILRGQLNPLSSRLLPFRYFTDWRVDQYYRRTLGDASLAERWADHYLAGLSLEPGDRVLDHGCGRGRASGLLAQLGFQVHGQEIAPHAWWARLDRSLFQVVPPEAPKLPWRSEYFSLAVDFQVLHYLDEEQRDRLIAEMFRVLRGGGYWTLLEANDRGYGSALPRRLIGRLHPLEAVRDAAEQGGFVTLDVSYEGFYSPALPRLVNFARKLAWPGPYDVADHGSWIESKVPPHRRAFWLLRLMKPNA